MADDYPITGLVKDWEFRIKEISANRYCMEGRRRSGETLSMEGADSVSLAEKIGEAAVAIDEKYFNPQKDDFKRYYFNTDIPTVFPRALKDIILEEILLGNWIRDYWSDYGVGVLLVQPFFIARKDVAAPLEYKEINDAHYWKDEVRLPGTEYFVAASFGS